MTPTPSQLLELAGPLLSAIFDVAEDYEAEVIQDLLKRAGICRTCTCGDFPATDAVCSCGDQP